MTGRGTPKSKSRSPSPSGRSSPSPSKSRGGAASKTSPKQKGSATTSPTGKDTKSTAGTAKAGDAKKMAASKMGGNKRRGQKKEEEKVELTEEQKEAAAKEKRDKFVKNYCTRLDFAFKDGSTKSKLLEGERFDTYVQLQRALARETPRSLQVFMCLSASGAVLTADTFKEANEYRIKEMPNAKIEATAKSKFKPQVDLRWEFYDYHGGAPEGWVDQIEVEKGKKEKAKRAAREREANDAAAAKMMERLTKGEDESDSSDGFGDL